MNATASTLSAHGSYRRTRDELATLSTPHGTRSWKPVPHHELVGGLIAELARREIAVVGEQYCTNGRADARLFGVIDLAFTSNDRPDFGMALGLRGANDRSLRIQIIAAARVFVCDNMAFSGSDGGVILARKHTSGLDLSKMVPPALDLYLEKQDAFAVDIDRMKDFALTDRRAKALIYDAFVRDSVMPLRLLPEVHRLYFDDDVQREKFADRSAWSLNNAFTEAVKSLQDSPRDKAGRSIGRYFGRVLHRDGGGHVAIPAGLPAEQVVIDVTPVPEIEQTIAAAAFEEPALDFADFIN